MTPPERSEYHRAYFKRRWATDPEFRERRRKANNAWRQRNIDKVNAARRKWHEQRKAGTGMSRRRAAQELGLTQFEVAEAEASALAKVKALLREELE